MIRNLICVLKNTRNHSMVVKRGAGHSKWANIRHIKGEKDAQRAAVFTRLSRQMKVAVQEGGSIDPKSNLKLEQVVEQAKRFNMPIATIQSILKSTQLNKNQSKIHLIEIKGPGSSVILCEVFTDNLHGLKQLISTVLKKHSAKYGDGGVKHMFEQKGLIETNLLGVENELEQATDNAIEAGAEDVTLFADLKLEFVCSSTAFTNVQNNLVKLKYKIISANIDYVPFKTQLLNETDLETCSNMYDRLEAMQEVVKLYDNIA